MEGRSVKSEPHPKLRHCVHCRRPFAVNPRVGKRHRFCSHPTCAHASRRAAQQKWLKQWREQNGGEAYFSGTAKLEKVRAWRARTPQYWKRTRLQKGARPGRFRLTRKLAAVLRSVALQDTIDTVLALQVGIMARLSGAGLQDTIAREMRATKLLGYAILRGQPIPRTR
jgi:hypothetical protein